MEAGSGLSKLPEDDNSTIQQLCREEEVGFVDLLAGLTCS